MVIVQKKELYLAKVENVLEDITLKHPKLKDINDIEEENKSQID